ncbi:hypothetical protein [Roseateles sp.]|jgi:hypothetical protein|uniref:hypothetical protein n=1 Tax=Roseateles sp. TaxID=1971397 RepID=UPI00391CB92B
MTEHPEPVQLEELGSLVEIESYQAWVHALCARYHTDTHWLNYFRLKKGQAKQLQDELIPLGRLAQRLSPRFSGAKLRFLPGSKQSFDAELIESTDRVAEIIEITLACNGQQDALSTECLVEHGFVPLYSEIAATGTKTNRQIAEPELVSLDAQELTHICFEMIRYAVSRKSGSGKYHSGISLLVAFDDFMLRPTEEDQDYLKGELLKLRSVFKTVYYVGLSGFFYFESVPTASGPSPR